ncbi:AMP-binding enzyme [Saccharothrix deserti]|uniref:AMP-binding enzyme n=1 Tax=Saccharothrix deserti TaxID=2593674 RepID=UPI001EE4A8A0|nr:hypothetical protein [Saccharothrix deserti]
MVRSSPPGNTTRSDGARADAEVTEAELVEWCKQNMAGFKYPRVIEFRDTLPMTATGKILKRELRT